MNFVTIKTWLAGLCVVALVGCGGGAASEAGTPILGGGSGSTGSSGSTSPAVTLTLSTSTVTAAAPATAKATVKTATGAPVVGQVVTFVSTAGLGAFNPSSALTNKDGEAVVSLAPTASTTSGADTAVASTTIGTTKLTGTAGFQLTATNLTIADFRSDIAALAAYGQTTLTVVLSDLNSAVPASIAISSACVIKGRATITPSSATTTTGQATFTYRDQGCGAFDLVDGLQASIVGSSAVKSLPLTLSAPSASSIAFVSATPDTIYLRGTGLAENSTVVFQVRDANGLGVPERLVVLAATTLAGGLTMDDIQEQVEKKSDSEGKVSVRINAGTVPTPVRIKATLKDTAISTVSNGLAIAVGLPSQNNFSLSQETLNIEGYDRDGTVNTYRIIASDRLGNPVPAGTAMNFVTESGQVQPIVFTTVGADKLSHATANYQSSLPRPVDGRVTVLAYALGEESFLDANGNNVYDPGEDYQDLGDVFVDRLFNGTYNALTDQFIALSLPGTGTDPCHVAQSPLLQLGLDSPSRVITNAGLPIITCTKGWGLAYVRRAAQTVLSTSASDPTFGSVLPLNAVSETGVCPSLANGGVITRLLPIGARNSAGLDAYNADDSTNSINLYRLGTVTLQNVGKSGTLAFFANDANPVAMNPMAAGTTISVASTSGLTTSVAGGSPIASTLSPTIAAVNFSFDDTNTSGSNTSGMITLSFRSPSGLLSSFSQRISRGVIAGATPCP